MWNLGEFVHTQAASRTSEHKYKQNARQTTMLSAFSLAKKKRHFLWSLLCLEVANILTLLSPERSLMSRERFPLSACSDDGAIADFRFASHTIRELTALLLIPNVVITPNRDCIPGEEALYLALCRLAYPSRCVSVCAKFARTARPLSRIFLYIVCMLHHRWERLLFFNESLLRNQMSVYCEAVCRCMLSIDFVCGFIDDAKLAICRPPDDLQRDTYSGRKRFSSLNFQAVTTPDGMCLHFSDPIGGRRHDTTLLQNSDLLCRLDVLGDEIDGKYLYRDPAYGVSRFIFSWFKGVSLSDEQRQFNASMSGVHVTMEWHFAVFKALWVFPTCKNKLLLSPVGKIDKVCMLLTNVHACVKVAIKLVTSLNVNHQY